MLLQLVEKLVLSLVLLAHPVSVEHSVHASEFVGGVLSVIALQMVVDGWQHVSVLIARADRRDQLSGGLLSQSTSQQPHW